MSRKNSRFCHHAESNLFELSDTKKLFLNAKSHNNFLSTYPPNYKEKVCPSNVWLLQPRQSSLWDAFFFFLLDVVKNCFIPFLQLWSEVLEILNQAKRTMPRILHYCVKSRTHKPGCFESKRTRVYCPLDPCSALLALDDDLISTLGDWT